MNENKILDFEKKRSQNKLPFKQKHLFIFGGFIFVVGLILIYIFYFSSPPEITEARYGKVVDGFTTRALLLRRERVFSAPQSGEIKFEKPEGTRVRKGAEVVSVDDSKVYSRMPGIISYAQDGLESILHPRNIEEITPQTLKKLDRKFKQNSQGNSVNEGDMLFKIVDNYTQYLLFIVDIQEARRYKKGEVVFIKRENDSSDLLRARVDNVLMKKDEAVITVKMDQFVKDWLNLRWVEIEFIKNTFRGIVIPHSAIFNHPSGKGVLILNSSNQYIFREVEVKKAVADKAVVKNLEVGDRVIINPETVNYGRRDNS